MTVSSHVRTESERSDDEKAVRGVVQAVDTPVDPDAHLSDAERASIVRELIYEPIDLEAHQATGSKAYLEARFVPDTMGKRVSVLSKIAKSNYSTALHSIPSRVLGSNEHWQRQS